jgi:hypothetical protein
MKMPKGKDVKDANRDPISGAPGSHPVGTGIGAAAGGMAAGAAAGTVAGPVGTVAGAVVGAVIGGLAGKATAEAIDPTVEDAYWREHYTKEPYYVQGTTFDDYAPAYRTGYEGRAAYGTRTFEEVERDLEQKYTQSRGASKLQWDRAKPAALAAWHRDRTSTR